MPAERGKPDSKGLNFFDITDFSPGIYDNSVTPQGLTAASTGIFPAPPGAADIAGTFGCIAEPNGGLGPFPARSGPPGQAGFAVNDLDGGIGFSGPIDVTAITNSLVNAQDELVFVFTHTFSIPGNTQTTGLYSYLVGTNSINGITDDVYDFRTFGKNFCCFPFISTILEAPVVVLAISGTSGPNPELFVYPDLATPTTFSAGIITTDPSARGVSFGHQGRIVVIAELAMQWPVPITQVPNEQFSYTDPSQTIFWPAQVEIFGPENPVGYGAVNTMSAGELFCIKRHGGAIIIQGDLNNPTVTTLPGVKSTGMIYGHSGTDQNGLYYCADKAGAWLWNGGNASQKISAQLEDNFFVVPTANAISDTNFYQYYCERWMSWMLFSNNWVFDSTKGAWWRLEDPTVTTPYYWYIPGWDYRVMYAASQAVSDNNVKFLWQYDLTVPRASYTWQSLPIKLPAEDRTTTVRELVIRASNPYGDPAPQIIASLIDDDGTVSVLDTWVMTPGIDTVQETRLNAGTKQTTTVAVHLSVSGTDSAPVVYGLSLGFRPREHVGLT